MTISKDRSELYEDLGAGDRGAVDRAFNSLVASLVESGLNTAGDDRAENMIGAITRYVEDSRS